MKMRLHKKISRTIRQRVRNRVLATHGSALLAESWNGRLLVEPGDFSVGRALLEQGSYDKAEIEWLIDCLSGSAELIVVVGAHIGSLLIPLSKHCQKIVGYEPDAQNFGLLEANLLINRVINANIFNVAVGAHEGKAAFARNSLNTGNSTIKVASHGDTHKCVLVDTVPLDTSLASLGTAIDLLIMDIEGHELHALKGSNQTLSRSKRLYIEYAPEHLKDHGSNPRDLLMLLIQHFNYLYTLDSVVTCKDAKDGVEQLLALPNKRGFLKNLLFTKELLPEKATQRNRGMF